MLFLIKNKIGSIGMFYLKVTFLLILLFNIFLNAEPRHFRPGFIIDKANLRIGKINCQSEGIEQDRSINYSDFKQITVDVHSEINLHGDTLLLFEQDEFLLKRGSLKIYNGNIKFFGSPKIIISPIFEKIIFEDVNINLFTPIFQGFNCDVDFNGFVKISSNVFGSIESFPIFKITNSSSLKINSFASLELGPNIVFLIESTLDKSTILNNTEASLIINNAVLSTSHFGLKFKRGNINLKNQAVFKNYNPDEYLKTALTWELDEKVNVKWSDGASLKNLVPLYIKK